MAVKVIKTEPANDVVKQIVCRGCGATLEYVPNDVKTRDWRDYTGGASGVEYIECPACNKEVTIRGW